MTKKLTYTFVHNQFESNDCILYSTEYINSSTLLDYKCSCGNISKIRYQDFRNGQRCSKCKLQKIKNKLRFDQNFIDNFIQNEGWENNSEYKNNRTPLNLICPNGHSIKMTFEKFQMGRRCSICFKNNNKGENHPNWIPDRTRKLRLDYLRITDIKKHALKHLTSDRNYIEYKKNSREFHIDHIFPRAAFINENLDQLYNKIIIKEICNHPTNLQILYKKENLFKKDTYDKKIFLMWFDNMLKVTMKKNYKTSDIQKLDPLDQIRLRPGMYIGNSEDPTKLLIECLDNAIDEVQNGHADKILVSINNLTGEFIVADSGRGLPFDYKLDLYEDPPIMICNSMFTSGKYKKNEEDSAYSVAAGLHGVGLTCVNALSEYMKIDVFRDNKHASYEFKYKEDPIRNQLKEKSNPKFSTIFTVKPHKDHFDTLKINDVIVRERLIIAASNFNKLQIALKIDDNIEYIKGSEDNLIETYLGKDVEDWHIFDSKNSKKEKSHEECIVKFGWDFSNSSTKMETFTTVNFVKVETGFHIKRVTDILENVFQKLAKKNKFEFNSNDCLNWLRLYINLKIVDVEFESQTKEKLSKKSDLSVMDGLENKIESYFKKYENTNDLLEKFEYYRSHLQNKKINNLNGKSNKRSIAGFNKLRDCTQEGGELLIGEGESAIGGLLKCRDSKKHAILPLRGVPKNVMTQKLSETLKNDVVQDVIKALGCGITPNCDLSKLRYKKIILSADADPAGEFITTLLITMFAKLTPEVIKAGHLYICKTPLFGYGFNSKFVPIWTDEEYEEARNKNIKIRRFKGLGQFNTSELKSITLDEKTRRLEKIEWCDIISKKLFEMMSSSAELKKKLASGEYEY